MGQPDREVLELAIEQAMERGYSLPEHFDNLGDLLDFHHEFSVIFSHEFALAYFGETAIKWPVAVGFSSHRLGWAVIPIPAWKWHLQQMVVSNDPVDYLRLF